MFGYNVVQFVGSVITVAIALLVFYAVARHSSTSTAKKALLLGLLLVVLFVTMADSCDDTGGYVDDAVAIGNDVADAIDEGADELGIPNNVSGEVYDLIFSKDNKQ